MNSDFPDLKPAAAPITPGAWPATAHQALSGARSIIRHGSAEIGRRLRLDFPALSEAEFLTIRNHYRGHRSSFDWFNFNTATLPADQTPTGYSWRWAAAPQIVDRHADVFDVSCEFVAVIRGPSRFAGAAWLSAAGALSAGRMVIAYFATGARWLAAATTMAKGAMTAQPYDEHFNSVSLLLHFEGANGSTTFIDSGPLGLAITRSGTSGVISTEAAAIGGSSFKAGTSQLNLPTNNALTLSADFTIEWRARHDNLSGKQQYFINFSGTNIQIAYQGGLFFWPVNATRTLSLTANTWAALAITRSGDTLYWFKDGTLLGSVTDTTNYNLSGGAISYTSASENMEGFLDEIRITKGICRYTANYTVSTTAFPDGAIVARFAPGVAWSTATTTMVAGAFSAT